MFKIKNISIFFIGLLFLANPSFGQKKSDKSDMEDERKQIQQELRQIEESFNAVKGLTKENISQLAMLNRKVELQEKYINNISKEIHLIDDDIYYSALEINQLKKQLDTLKSHYARTVVYAYKNRSSYDYLNFLFSANSFNDAIKRIAYLKSYRNYRQQQMGDILKTRDLITKRYNQQKESKDNKENALATRSNEYKVLEEKRVEKDSIISTLNIQAGDLQKQIAKKKERDKELKSSIARVVRQEISEARKLAQEEARKRAEEERKARIVAEEQERLRTLAAAKEITATPAPSTNSNPKTEETGVAITSPERKMEKTDVEASVKTRAVPNSPTAITADKTIKVSTPKPQAYPIKSETPAVVQNKQPEGGYLNVQASDIALNGSFEQNRGRLPSPVDNGFISLGFGRYKIEGVGPDIVGDNPGLTYTAPTGSPVKAVFDGEVAGISNIGGMSLVILRHGKYFTAYSNLGSVNVSKGTTVRRGQILGKVGADEETGNGKLDFILMIEERNVDPRSWLAR
ncbi:MAG: peptidoglycan DD-metalloendopeptidase family protein [Niabella sp.]